MWLIWCEDLNGWLGVVPLTRGLGEDAEDLEELGAYSVYGLLVPEDGTLFNVGYSVEVGGDVVDLV